VGVADQLALRGLLKIRDLAQPLVSVHRIKPDLPVAQQW
jgi:hypothetical protein